MNENENKHMILARMQQLLAKQGVYTSLSLHVTDPSFSCFTYADDGDFKSIYSTSYTEEQLLGVWSSIDSDGVEALARLQQTCEEGILE